MARMQAGEVIDEHGQALTPKPATASRHAFTNTAAGLRAPHSPSDETVLFLGDEWIVVADKPHFLLRENTCGRYSKKPCWCD